MCGIAGTFAFKGSVGEEYIRRMGDAQAHRGPDDSGVYINPGKTVGLGHRRLAIIDLSAGGHQPMSNEDATVWITFNGEIYNYKELRKSLEGRHVFRSQSDTEVIVHLYEEYGEDCVTRLRGMFAFAIWDENKKQLFLARDRAGKKPLKYYIDEHRFVFASELKSILADPSIPRVVDAEAIHHYLTLQYVPHPQTGFQGIVKLPPAHSMVVKDGKMTMRRYWKLDYRNKENHTSEEWKEQIRNALEESVRIRLISDVPLGAFLSGGVDSSAVVAMMARHSSTPVKTFSIGFEDAEHNELGKAKLVSQLFSTDHTEFVVRPNALEIFEKLVYHYEEPYADSSAIPTYYVSKLTRQHVTVALNGDGGDESFAGYPWYAIQKLVARLDVLPRGLRTIVFQKILANIVRLRKTTATRRLHLGLSSAADLPARRYLRYFTSSYFSEEEKLQMYTPEFRAAMQAADTASIIEKIYTGIAADDPLDYAMGTDIESYLPDALLAKVDIATMANSLEARSPFLDNVLMELAASIPAEQKMPGGKLKHLLKESLKEILPSEILYAPKHGFTVPLGAWFRGPLKQMAEEKLLDPQSKIQSYIKTDAIRKLLDEHQSGRIDHGSRLWNLLTLEQWLETFFSTQQSI